jgi:hypothetical protein
MLSFKEYMILEGNPLSRMQKNIEDKRHFSAISAERSHLTPEENSTRMASLENDIKELGYGYKKSRGMWEGGGENSIVINARAKGSKAGNQLRKDAIRLGKKYDQDSVLHHDGDVATLHGTNETGWPGAGNTKRVGRVEFGARDADFQTQYNPSKPEDVRPTFSTTFERRKKVKQVRKLP